MAAHQPTKALASFAADLDPAALPPEVRQKLGWLLLDCLRVCSIGARLPWSDWARKYIGLVGIVARAERDVHEGCVLGIERARREQDVRGAILAD